MKFVYFAWRTQTESLILPGLIGTERYGLIESIFPTLKQKIQMDGD